MDINAFANAIKQNKKLMMAIIFILAFSACFAGYIISKNSGEIVILPSSETEYKRENNSYSNIQPNQKDSNNITDKNDDITNNASKSTVEKEKIKVYVAGCVKRPGVYIIEKGSILQDAIIAAGGLTEEADPENINMVYELMENVMIKILSKKVIDTQENTYRQQVQNKASSKVIIGKTEGSGVFIDVPNYKEEKQKYKDSRININTASQEELDRLPGIGPATARDIIEYRNKNGNYKTISDIMKVPGIKQSRYNSIKDLICVE